MAWFNGIINKIVQKRKYAKMLNGYTPIFSAFGTDIYASDVVQQAIRCIVREMVKITPMHVKTSGADVQPVNSSIQRVLRNPNPLMSKSAFIEKVMWLWIMDYNAYIIPAYDTWKDENGTWRRRYTGLYPVRPSGVEFTEDDSGRLYITMSFVNGVETTLPYADVIHLRYDYSVNEFMGGDMDGRADFRALLDTLEINDSMVKGIRRAMNSSYAVNGAVKYNTMMDGGKTEAAIKELERLLSEGKSGFLPLDLKADYIPLKKDIKMVDSETLKFIDERILRWFGTSIPILIGDYTKEQYEAFYQKTLEPFIVYLHDEFTRVLFTDRERAFGNEVQWYPKNMIFMNMTQTLEMVRLLGDSGGLYENEKRVAFGLQPLKELAGVRMQSLNYVNVDIASNYQVGQQQSEGEENGTEEQAEGA